MPGLSHAELTAAARASAIGGTESGRGLASGCARRWSQDRDVVRLAQVLSESGRVLAGGHSPKAARKIDARVAAKLGIWRALVP
jgi:hypothetical protein